MIVIFALALTLLMASNAQTFDIGETALDRRSAQNAADANFRDSSEPTMMADQ